MAATAVKVGVIFSFTAKFPVDVPVPPGVVTSTTPATIDSARRVAVIVLLLVTIKLATAAPLTVTSVAPVKFVPLMTKVEPPQPSVIAVVPSLVKLVIVGRGVNTNCTFPAVVPATPLI